MLSDATVYRTTDQFYIDAYEGSGGFAGGAYLVPHPLESETKYRNRQQLAVYYNYVKKMANIHHGYLWSRAPQRSGPEAYTAFVANADGAGASLDTLMRSYQRLAMILGTVYLFVDRDRGTPLTRADQGLPYLAMRTPAATSHLRLDAVGRVVRVTFSEQDDAGAIRYRHFDRAGWRLSEDAAGERVIEQGSYTLGRPPVVALHAREPLKRIDHRAVPWVHDLAQLNWRHYNLLSELTDILRNQTFSILTLPAKDDTERDRLAGMAVGTDKAMTFDPEGGGEPKYLAPPAAPAEIYQKELVEVVLKMYELANLEFTGGVQASGVALAFQFDQANKGLLELAGQAQAAEQQIARFVMGWVGGTFDGHIAYNTDFNLVDLSAEISQALEALNLQVAPTFDAEVKRMVARQMLSNHVSPEVLAAIDQEIDAGGDVYGDRAAQAAGGSV